MKKLYFILLLACVSVSTEMSAQFSNYNLNKSKIKQEGVYPKFHIGPRFGFSVNSNKAKGADDESLIFFQGGVSADFRIASVPLYIESGIGYINRGVKKQSRYYSYYDYAVIRDEENSWHNHEINMPILISYHYYINDNVAIQPFIGPVIGFAMPEDENNTYFSAFIRFGCGVNYKKFYANIGYDIGDAYGNDEADKLKTHTFFMSLGYNFAQSR